MYFQVFTYQNIIEIIKYILFLFYIGFMCFMVIYNNIRNNLIYNLYCIFNIINNNYLPFYS